MSTTQTAPLARDDKATQPTPLMLTDAQAAALVSLSRSGWRALVASGRAPGGVKLGRSRRWLRSELVAWLEAGGPSAREWQRRRKGRGAA